MVESRCAASLLGSVICCAEGGCIGEISFISIYDVREPMGTYVIVWINLIMLHQILQSHVMRFFLNKYNNRDVDVLYWRAPPTGGAILGAFLLILQKVASQGSHIRNWLLLLYFKWTVARLEGKAGDWYRWAEHNQLRTSDNFFNFMFCFDLNEINSNRTIQGKSK